MKTEKTNSAAEAPEKAAATASSEEANRSKGRTGAKKWTTRKAATKPVKQRGTKGRAGSKTEQVLALLRQPTGASLEAIMKPTGWQAHSVRGFISGQLGKKLGLRVKSVKRDGARVYSLPK